MKAAQVQRLERLARLRSDIEMRRFSAYRAHVESARRRIAELQDELAAIYRADASFSVEAARLANLRAGDCSRALVRAEADLQQLLPGYETARKAALREFGRVEVLEKITGDLTEAERDRAAKKRLPPL